MRFFSKRIQLLASISLAVGVVGFLMVFFNFLPLLRLENFTRDLRTIFGRKAPVADDLVLLTIDDASLRLDGLMDDEIHSLPEFVEMQKGWPWSRSVYAATLDKLMKAGARVVAFDLLFQGAGSGDEEFSAMLRHYQKQVVIGGAFTGTDTPRPSFSRPATTLLTPGEQDEAVGFATFIPDIDGVVRAALFRVSPEDFAERGRLADAPVFASISSQILRKTGVAMDVPVARNQPFRFGGPPGTYQHRSIYEIFIPSLWHANYQDGAFFKDKIVMVGPEGHWSHDEHPTPFVAMLGARGLMSGPEVHLQAVAAARAHEWLMVPGLPATSGILALAACLGFWLNLTFSPFRRILAFLFVAAGYWLAAQSVYDDSGLIFPVAAPLLVMPMSILGGILYDFSRERFERLRVRATLERYVSGSVAREILDNPKDYLTSLVGVRKKVTVMFVDLRNFTTMVNSRDAQELVVQLNEYYARVIEDVFHHLGTLDKIMGDGMMVVWGNLQSDGVKQDAVHAVQAALAMQRSMDALNLQWIAEDRTPLAIGIGMAHGECLVGNVGSQRQMDLTVIGDAANLAARLQALSREKGENILFDSEVAELVADAFQTCLISTETIRGIELPVMIHAIKTGPQAQDLPLVVAAEVAFDLA